MSRAHLKTELGRIENGVEKLQTEIHVAEAGACYKTAPRLQALVAAKKEELAKLEARAKTVRIYLCGAPPEEETRKEVSKNTIVAYRTVGA